MSDLSNSGIYAFGPAILEEIPSGRPVDIGHDLLPRLVNRARVVPIESYFRDVGTFEGYYRALLEWKEHSPR
jgi:mannose-1-phosphate guanylyltransferase